jgi:hypothetical protein
MLTIQFRTLHSFDAQIVYVAGNTGGALDGLEGYGSNDIYLSKISVDGAYIESERWGTSSYDFAQNMDSDLVYNYIYLTGQYGSAAVLGQYQSGLPFNYSAAPIVQRGQTFSNDSLIVIYQNNIFASSLGYLMIGMALIAFTGHLIIAAINIRKIPQRIARRQQL